MSIENTVSNGGDDMFFDAVSTTSQEPDQSTSETTPPPPKTTTTVKRTVLTYSERNGINVNTVDETPSAWSSTPLDPYDDFALSNKLNSITLSNSLELHHYVFHNDLDSIRTYIRRYEEKSRDQLPDYLSIRDIHGNTPLHLATMLGHQDVVNLLTKYGSVVKARNKQLWTPLNEAISFGDRELIRTVLVKFEGEVDQILNDSKPKILSALQDMLDFYVEVFSFFIAYFGGIFYFV